jgi:hypothetical protein
MPKPANPKSPLPSSSKADDGSATDALALVLASAKRLTKGPKDILSKSVETVRNPVVMPGLFWHDTDFDAEGIPGSIPGPISRKTAATAFAI